MLAVTNDPQSTRWCKTDLRLFVGSRDCSKLAEKMDWQVDAVQRILDRSSLSVPRVMPVLCFVHGQWPLISTPESYKNVRLEGQRSIRTLLSKSKLLSGEEIDHRARVIAAAFASK